MPTVAVAYWNGVDTAASIDGTVTWIITNAGTTSATTTGATITVNQVWAEWVRVGNMCEHTSGTATTAATIVWDNWHRQGNYRANYTDYPMVAHAMDQSRARLQAQIERRIVSPEERARREAAERLRAEQAAKEAEARQEANRKAEKLLRSVLTPQQIEDLERQHCFFVEVRGQRYRIDRGQHGNVKLLDAKGQIEESYCIQPRGGLPDADAMCAQKLLLETDPESFKAIANVTRRDGTHRLGRPVVV